MEFGGSFPCNFWCFDFLSHPLLTLDLLVSVGFFRKGFVSEVQDVAFEGAGFIGRSGVLDVAETGPHVTSQQPSRSREGLSSLEVFSLPPVNGQRNARADVDLHQLQLQPPLDFTSRPCLSID